MKRFAKSPWMLVVIANVACWGVLSFYQTTTAAPPAAGQPFSPPAKQRAEMIAELQAIADLLEEQNALLRSGKLTVVVAQK